MKNITPSCIELPGSMQEVKRDSLLHIQVLEGIEFYIISL